MKIRNIALDADEVPETVTVDMAARILEAVHIAAREYTKALAEREREAD